MQFRCRIGDAENCIAFFRVFPRNCIATKLHRKLHRISRLTSPVSAMQFAMQFRASRCSFDAENPLVALHRKLHRERCRSSMQFPGKLHRPMLFVMQFAMQFASRELHRSMQFSVRDAVRRGREFQRKRQRQRRRGAFARPCRGERRAPSREGGGGTRCSSTASSLKPRSKTRSGPFVVSSKVSRRASRVREPQQLFTPFFLSAPWAQCQLPLRSMAAAGSRHTAQQNRKSSCAAARPPSTGSCDAVSMQIQTASQTASGDAVAMQLRCSSDAVCDAVWRCSLRSELHRWMQFGPLMQFSASRDAVSMQLETAS